MRRKETLKDICGLLVAEWVEIAIKEGQAKWLTQTIRRIAFSNPLAVFRTINTMGTT